MGRGSDRMLQTVLSLVAVCSVVQGSGFHPAVAPAPAPVVTSTSTQFFERIFNRLVAAVPALENVIPVAPAPPVVAPPVFVQPVPNSVPLPVPVPTQSAPQDPNVAIAIATAHAAAPVATILLPPFPFGPPPGFEFIQSPVYVPDESKAEATTARTTTPEEVTTKQPATTQVPSNSDNNFVQALPSNENQMKFKTYYAPPLPAQQRPQKLKTSVEVVPVPLAYIAPPPLKSQAIKSIKHYHKKVPARIVIRPVRVHTIRVPAKIIIHSVPIRKYGPKKSAKTSYSHNISRSSNLKEKEPTTFRPSNIPIVKPPRL